VAAANYDDIESCRHWLKSEQLWPRILDAGSTIGKAASGQLRFTCLFPVAKMAALEGSDG
jgi:hypothetical protein